MQPIWKLLLLVFALPILVKALSPPQPIPSSKEHMNPSKSNSLLVRWPRVWAAFRKAITPAWMLTEVALTFAASEMCPPNLSRLIVKVFVHTAQPDLALARVTTLTPTFFIGVCLMIMASLLRLYCYQVLGRFFTLELSIRNEHKLVKTGIYSVVRHPAYVGTASYVLGEQLAFLDKSSWLLACSRLAPPSDYALTCLSWGRAVMFCIGLILLHCRMNDEDGMLERHFGKEWRDWAKRVPYRMVPGVY
ncbi:hypothetical protein ID866_5291 [Astraeus odoratus]|nr:hypothetical protein ID866_5291 [Astraeus odoratus]